MKKLTVIALCSIFLSCPLAQAVVGDDPYDSGKGYCISYPFWKMPIGESAASESASAKENQEKEAQARLAERKAAQEKTDKMVDDAIRRAWVDK